MEWEKKIYVRKNQIYPAIKKVNVRSPDGDIDYFDIVEGVLQGDTLALYLFVISLDYVLRTCIYKM